MTTISRRLFIGLGAAALGETLFGGADGDLLPLGVITYSFASMPMTPFSTSRYARAAGLTALELKIEHLQQDAGAPGDGKRINGFSKDLRKQYDDWFATRTIADYRALRRRYDDLGVSIHTLKTVLGPKKCREGGTADFWCEVAKELGADTVSMESPKPAEWAEKGPFFAALAKKHDLRFAFHNHLALQPDTYDGPESLLACSDRLGLCFDVGHFTAKNGRAAVMPFVRKHASRLFALHIKDRKELDVKTPACPMGEGDVPFKEIFAFVRDEGLKVRGDVELEYGYDRKTTDAVKEVARCAAWCRRKFKEV